MFSVVNWLLLVTIAAATHTKLAPITSDKFFHELEEINLIRSNYNNVMKNYVGTIKEEIRTLLNNVGAQQEFIKDINELEFWWRTDMNRREVAIFNEYLSMVLEHLAAQEHTPNLRAKLNNSLFESRSYWHRAIDRKMRLIRNNSQIYQSYYKEDEEEKETVKPTLNKMQQNQYDYQIKNLTRTSNVTKLSIEIELNNYPSNQQNNTDQDEMNFSERTRLDQLKALIRKQSYRFVDQSNTRAVSRINDLWNTRSEDGPTEDDFGSVYQEHCRLMFNVLKRVHKTLTTRGLMEYGLNFYT